MEANTTSIVFVVNRDIDELDAANGEILFSADKVRFDVGLNSILFGNQTLNDIIGATGSGGEINVIEGITTNGAPVAPENKIVNITIPAPGDANVIEKITTNGVELAVGENKTVNIEIPAPGDANVIETVKVNGTALTPDSDKAVDITVPSVDGKLDATNGVAFVDFKVYPTNAIMGASHLILTHESITIGENIEYKGDEISYSGESYEFNTKSNGIARLKDIPTISTNGVAVSPDVNKNINIDIPSVPDISGLATKQEVSDLTITTDKVTDLGSYKNPTISAAAALAITDINNANDIATIKSTLTNFLQNFVIETTP